MATGTHAESEPEKVGQPREPGLPLSQHEDQEVRGSVDDSDSAERFQHTWRILLISIVLSVLTLISGIDATVITTSLSTIAREIGGAREYVWVAQSYLFACTVPQPFYGQIANIFGRRNPLLVSIALFVLGSGIAGGARNVATLIAGRVVQGLGTGGINVLPEIVVCDLIPPRHRGPYLSVMLSTAAIGSTIGPVIGGAFAQVDWRWVFWLNLPVSGICAISIVFLLNVRYQRDRTWRTALARVDFLGNAIFVPSMVSLFFGLIMGGTDGYPWDSWRIILPIVLGVAGWALFHVHQGSRLCPEPSMPPHLFKNRTSTMAFAIIFLASIIVQAVSYFLPIYFQAVKDVSPLISGVYFLPFTLALLPFGGIAAAILSKTGKYKPMHWAGFAMVAIGTGLFSMLDEGSSRGEWIGYQVIAASGTGFIFTVSLPSTLAALPEEDVATATSTFAFVRALGLVWGVTMSSIVFNGQVNKNLYLVDDTNLRRLLADGGAYTFASGSEDGRPSIGGLPEPARSQVVSLYENALSVVWLVFVGVAGLGFLAAFGMKHIELRKVHQTEFGLVDGTRTDFPPVSKAEQGLREETTTVTQQEKPAAP
ncbi:hypothetical protein DL771_000102 [Monosporascus sp. 5C6A]|nr:hypothetical protein DL771_000102 [Monosporascus sp. 5C6A]